MCGLIDFCRKKIWSQWISFFPSKVNKSTHLPHQKSINRVIIVPIETNLMAEISYHKISASKIKSWVWIPLIAKCTWYKILFVSNFLQVCVFQWALLVGSNLKKLKMCSRYGSFEQLLFEISTKKNLVPVQEVHIIMVYKNNWFSVHCSEVKTTLFDLFR